MHGWRWGGSRIKPGVESLNGRKDEVPPRGTFNPKSEEEIKPGHKDGKGKKGN